MLRHKHASISICASSENPITYLYINFNFSILILRNEYDGCARFCTVIQHLHFGSRFFSTFALWFPIFCLFAFFGIISEYFESAIYVEIFMKVDLRIIIIVEVLPTNYVAQSVVMYHVLSFWYSFFFFLNQKVHMRGEYEQILTINRCLRVNTLFLCFFGDKV